jgi:low affinity Fe/Cu permease
MEVKLDMTQQVSLFSRFARVAAILSGKPSTFAAAVAVILLWATTGPIFKFSDTWQLVINTGTTIVTFLMVFLIQNTQNRDTEAVHIKLDEMIRSTGRARNELLDLEGMDTESLDQIRKHYLELADQARKHLDRRRGKSE